MLDEKTRQMISEKAQEIMAQIQGGRLYGEPVNLLDPEQILVAAYLTGETAADRERSFPPKYILHDPY